jgi:hypothetical protein
LIQKIIICILYVWVAIQYKQNRHQWVTQQLLVQVFSGFSGDGEQATTWPLNSPTQLKPIKTVYIFDSNNYRIKKN